MFIRNAAEYGFGVNRIVAMGYSAGGHLALTTGMLPTSGGSDRTLHPRDAAARRADEGGCHK